MRGNLFPTTIYLDKELKQKIERLAFVDRKPKAEVIRAVLSEGLKVYKAENNEAQKKALLGLIGLIPKGSGIPSDLSVNHDKYLWDE